MCQRFKLMAPCLFETHNCNSEKTCKISIFAQKPKNPFIGSYVSLTLLHSVNDKHDFISGRGPLIYYEQWETRIMIFLNFEFIRF